MKKEELLEVYDLNSKLKGTQARKSFYKEIYSKKMREF